MLVINGSLWVGSFACSHKHVSNSFCKLAPGCESEWLHEESKDSMPKAIQLSITIQIGIWIVTKYDRNELRTCHPRRSVSCIWTVSFEHLRGLPMCSFHHLYYMEQQCIVKINPEGPNKSLDRLYCIFCRICDLIPFPVLLNDASRINSGWANYHDSCDLRCGVSSTVQQWSCFSRNIA